MYYSRVNKISKPLLRLIEGKTRKKKKPEEITGDIGDISQSKHTHKHKHEHNIVMYWKT
jgi:hypothetical protein